MRNAGLWSLASLLMGAGSMIEAADPAPAAAAVNQFGVALQKALPKPAENLVYSPFSVASAMSMTLAGARGETASQIAAALQIQNGAGSIHANMAALLDALKSGAGDSDKLAIANAMWPQTGAPLLQPFVETVHGSYRAESKEMDYQKAAEASREAINRWVTEHTAGKIPDLLPRGSITALTRLVLTNAVYFKGQWANSFDPAQTSDETFFLTTSTNVSTPMMHRNGKYGYTANGEWQSLELPYKDGRLSMVILLPAQKNGLAKLESQLSAEMLRNWTMGGRSRPVDVTIPKFKLESSFSLNDALAKLGIRDAFTDAADFSGINGQKNLSLTAVLHKAMIEVNEEGTEAAAATGAVIGLTSAMPSEPAIFRADHPFLYLIQDRKTHCILFAGRVMNPKN